MGVVDYTRRSFLKTMGLGVAALAIPGCKGGLQQIMGAPRKNKPNIIFIMADDLGYGDLGCYGATKVRTPNIDQIANEGIRFTDAHSPSAVCSPTRYGVLTGRYCWRTRLKEWVLKVDDPLLIEKGRMTVASLLKSAGYATGCVGKWHLGFGEGKPDWNGELRPGPLEVGFDYYFGVPTSHNWPPFVYVENHYVVGRRDDEFIEVRGGMDPKEVRGITAKRRDEEIALVQTAKAIEFIKRNRAKPFFLYFPTCNIHLPHRPNERFRGTSEAASYGDFIHELDWTVGEILKTLEALKLKENTLIIITSDNGARMIKAARYSHRSCGSLRGQKANIYEGGHRVPFVARWPDRIRPGSTSDETICLTDLLASCAAVVGVKLPADAGEDSYNILPAIFGQELDKPIREATVHHSCWGMFAIRQGPWKLILGSGSDYSRQSRGQEGSGVQLYNLAEDLGETRNLCDEHPEIVERLTGLLEKYKRQGHSQPS